MILVTTYDTGRKTQ